MKKFSSKTKLIGTVLAVLVTASMVADAGADQQVQLSAEIGTPVLLSNRAQRTFIKVGLTGFNLPSARERSPVNIAVVLDRSSSMSGDKIKKAREAARLLVDRLGPEDMLSVVAYDSTVQVLIPATRVGDLPDIDGAIGRLKPGGSTALFAGVSKGINEVDKFLDDQRVNRVIVLSDGQANVGPRSPNELGRLGAAAAKRGISITTIGLGLGYNEDLMSQLAMKSDGNHAFAPTARELAQIFEYELGDVLSVVAQEVSVKIMLHPHVRPVRVLNREAEIRGHQVILSLNQLYAQQEKFVLVEVETPPGPPGSMLRVADVSVTYANLMSGRTDRLAQHVSVAYSPDANVVATKTNPEVMVAAVESIATDNNRQAVQLRDQGKVQEAKTLLQNNMNYLQENAIRYKSKKLEKHRNLNADDAKNLEPTKWKKRRKVMRKRQYETDMQQSF